MDEKTEFEKLIDGVSQLASIVKAYYDSLIESGFSKKDAILLTLEYQKSLFGMVNKQ